MVGILVQLALSWLLLWLFDKQSLHVLGLRPDKSRSLHLLSGFGIAAICCAAYIYLQTVFSKAAWSLNEAYTLNAGLSGSWWVLKSVLFEELIFRGALLYIAMRKIGVWKACVISAVGFGVYHWFSFNAFGNPVQMVFVFLLTGVWGLMFAYTFAITNSLYLPIGIHFGWNVVNIIVFSNGPLGSQLLIATGGSAIGTGPTIIILVFQIAAVPLLVYWLLLKSLMKKQPA